MLARESLNFGPVRVMFSLEGKIAIVTGAGRELGAQIAKGFSHRWDHLFFV